MATALSLDDLGAIGKHASRPRKKKTSIKAKSTAKVAKKVKGVKTVSGTKIVKKKKTKGMLDRDDPLAVAIDAEKMYREIAVEQEERAVKEVKIKDRAKKKAQKEAGVKTIKIKKLSDVKEVPKKKKKKITGLPAIDEGKQLDRQLVEVLDAVPDAMKQENEQIVEYMTMFNKLRRMARICERLYFDKKQSRDVYALMKIYDQMREIIADLRALRDVGEMGEVLNTEVLGPLAQSNATVLVSFHQQINAWAKAHLPTDSIANFREASDVIVKTLAKDMEQSYHSSLDKTVAIFSQNG